MTGRGASRRRGDLIVPPDGERSRAAMLEHVERLGAAQALDGADNPLRALIEDLRRWWQETEPRPIPRWSGAFSVASMTADFDGGASNPAEEPVLQRDSAPPSAHPSDTAPTEGRGPDAGGRRHNALKLLMVLAFAGDVANFYMALSVVGNTAPIVTVLVVVALACSALGLSHLVGRFLRDRADGMGSPRGAIGALTAVVLLLGMSAAGVRLAAPLPETGSGDAFGGADSALLSPIIVNVVLTVLLLVLFLASAAMAAVLGYDARDRPAPPPGNENWGGWTRARLNQRAINRRAQREIDRLHADAKAEEAYRVAMAGHWHRAEFLLRETEIRIAEHSRDPRRTTVLTHSDKENFS